MLLQTRFAGLADRVALVTGAGRGIGRCIATNLEAQGCRVAYLDRVLPAELTSSSTRMPIESDLRAPADIESACSQVESAFGPTEILVSNAGIIRTGAITDIDLDDWSDVMAVNSTAAFLLARRVIPQMRAAGFGRLISVSSNAAKMGGVNSAPVYGASKAATDTMWRSDGCERRLLH
jgi:3-oxoacyl-[acyl-carrier protein] reductase